MSLALNAGPASPSARPLLARLALALASWLDAISLPKAGDLALIYEGLHPRGDLGKRGRLHAHFGRLGRWQPGRRPGAPENQAGWASACQEK